MKSTHSLVVSISKRADITKIKEDTKYINIDITNCDYDVIDYFLKNGKKYLYSEIIDNTRGYIYVSYDEFYMAETIINNIYANMDDNLSKLEIARYLYVTIAKYVYFDINIEPDKNEMYNFSLTSNINNLWGSLALGRVTNKSVAKIYYYLCRRMEIDVTIEETENLVINRLIIDNSVLKVNLFGDIPYIQMGMVTKYFTPYNDDIDMDKRVGYIKNKYMDMVIDKALKNIDYTKENCIRDILYKTQNIIDIDNIKPVELGIIYEDIFSKYCPNYNIKINNLFLNGIYKNHFIMISYNDEHYSYNYKKKMFVMVNDMDLIDNINMGKIGLYLDEFIPNIEVNLNV